MLHCKSLQLSIHLDGIQQKLIESIDEAALERAINYNTGDHLKLQLLCCVVLMLVVFIQGLRTWKLLSLFNEAQSIAISKLLSALMFACMIPLYYSAVNPSAKEFLQIMFIQCCNFTILIAMYGHRVYIVYLRPETNTRAAYNNEMQLHVLQEVKERSE